MLPKGTELEDFERDRLRKRQVSVRNHEEKCTKTKQKQQKYSIVLSHVYLRDASESSDAFFSVTSKLLHQPKVRDALRPK